MANPNPPRRLRRRWKVLAAVVVVAVLVVAFLPAILSTGFARSKISDGLNLRVSPGRLEFESIELGWFSPTRLGKVMLLDPNRKVVARVPVAVLDKTLAALILADQSPMVLSLPETALEVERSQSGLVDLAEALKTIIANPDPKRDLTIRIDHGTLAYRDPFLAEPAMADAVDLTLRIPTAPNPVTWSLKLGRGDSRLEIQGDFDRWLAKGGPPQTPELQVGVVGKSWPFVAKVADVDAQGKLDGTLDFARKRGKWVLSGDARLNALKARGKPFSGDTLAVDKLEAGWDLLEGDEGWTIRRLALNSSLGEIKAEGQLSGPNASGQQKIEGKIDLAAIARQLPHALKLRDGLTVDRGTARLTLDLSTTSEASTYEVEARVADLVARDRDRNLTLREPATLTGRVIRKGKDSSVDQITLKTSFLDARARGRLEDGVNLEARIDLDGLRRQLGEWVDLGGVELAGRVDLTGSYRALAAGGSTPLDAEIEAVRPREFLEGTGPDAPAHFLAKVQATGRDFRIDGIGLGPIRRDSLSIQGSANGGVDSSGFPLDWNAVFVQLKAGEAEARVRLDARDRQVLVAALAKTSIGSGRGAPVAAAELTGDWSADRRVLSIAAIRSSLVGSTNRPLISAKGHLDLASGELVLEALQGQQSDAFSIAPDGLRIAGLTKGLASLRFEGGLLGDAARLDQLGADLSGRPPLGLAGRWSAVATARGEAEGIQMAAKVGMVETRTTSEKPARPTSLAINVHYTTKLDRLYISEFAVATAYGTLDASGLLYDPLGARKVELNGKLAPDFAAITALLVANVEKGAKVEGQPRKFRASGSLAEAAGGWKGLDAEFGFELVGADIYGMKFGSTPVVMRAKAGNLTFDPISTSINEGHIRLEPELDLDATDGPVLRLAKNSTIREAKINDEVSKRVLAFVAPVLDQATRASGLVSVDLDHAEFPIGAGRGRQAKVEGAVVFQDVEFAPGPLAGEILGAIGRRDLTLKLDQPVTLTIADGRINQRGMSIPVGDLTRLELSGWVDFDRKIALVATVPVTPAMLGNNPLLSDIASGTKVQLPIGGTLDKPEIDRDAFSTNLQDLAKTLLARGATRGALELLMRLSRPKDPNAPPPPPRMTPEERRTQRQEKKAIRRGEIPPPNPEGPKD